MIVIDARVARLDVPQLRVRTNPICFPLVGDRRRERVRRCRTTCGKRPGRSPLAPKSDSQLLWRQLSPSADFSRHATVGSIKRGPILEHGQRRQKDCGHRDEHVTKLTSSLPTSPSSLVRHLIDGPSQDELSDHVRVGLTGAPVLSKAQFSFL